MAITQNIGRFAVAPLGPGMRIVATPSNGPTANVDPVLVDPAELAGTDGADGADGDPGPAGASLIYGTGAPTNATGLDGDSYVNTDTGDLYWKDSGVYVFQFNITGPAGDPGPPGGGLIPDQYTDSNANPFDEAYIAAVVTADVSVNILIDDLGDQRADNTLPAPLNGDMNRHLVRYDADTATWTDIGPFVGIKGETGAKGNNGTAGSNGTDGEDGADGKSAYELAVIGGFVGTESQWLASLKGADGESAYDAAVDAGFVGTESQWLASLNGTDGESSLPNEVVALTEAKIAAIVAADVDWLIVASPDNRANKAAPAALNGDQSRNLLKYDADANAWTIIGPWQGDKGTPGTSGIGIDGVNIYREAGVAGGGYFYEMNAALPKTYTSVFAKQYGGSGDFDFQLFVNGASVYAKADVAFGTPWSATGLDIDVPVGAECYIQITPSASTVTGVWVQFGE